jgi:hypothetical protein
MPLPGTREVRAVGSDATGVRFLVPCRAIGVTISTLLDPIFPIQGAEASSSETNRQKGASFQ